MKRPTIRIPETGRKTKLMLIGLSLSVLLVVGFVFSEAYLILSDDLDYDSGSNSSITFGVYKYEDGEFIPIALERFYLSPFEIEGLEVTELAIKVDWISTGQGIDWDSFSLTGGLDVSYLKEEWIEPEREGSEGYWRGVWYPCKAISFDSTIASSSWHNIFVLGTDLCLEAQYIENSQLIDAHVGESGWYYQFSGSVYGSVYDEMGSGPLTDSTSFGGLVIWVTYVVNYNLDADIV